LNKHRRLAENCFLSLSMRGQILNGNVQKLNEH
jgi:hypothetical protein